MINKNDKIFVAGHNGMVGRALWMELKQRGYNNLIGLPKAHYDLTNQRAVETLFEEYKPDYVFVAAAKVGGIGANNTQRGQFIYDNLMIQSNLIHYSYVYEVKKLLFLGSSCIYPKFAEQPIKEEAILSGYLEPTNSPYAIAKIAGIEMVKSYREQYGCNYISVMPTNLYGFNDYYDEFSSHVIPAIILKIRKAIDCGSDSVHLWGDGTPLREFLHASDLADACVLLLENYNGDKIVNIGSGEEVSIAELANIIAECMNYNGKIIFEKNQKNNGTPRKILNSEYLKSLIDWKPKYNLRSGISEIVKTTEFEKPKFDYMNTDDLKKIC